MFRTENRISDIVQGLLDDVLPNGRGALVMLKAYLDRGSKKQAAGIMCVATALFKPTPYKQFCRDWERFLDRWDAPVFHATDFYNGAGKFWRKRPNGTIDPKRKAMHDEDSRLIPNIIAAHVRRLFVMSFREQEFESVAPPEWRAHFGTLSGVAAQMAAGAIGHWANKTKFFGRVAYFIESGDDGVEMERGLRRLYDEPKQRKHTRMATNPTLVDKGQARGLEVADFLAWHWNKFYVDTLASFQPRTMRKDIASLMRLLNMKEEKITVHVVTGEQLENFLIENGCHRKFKIVSGGAAS